MVRFIRAAALLALAFAVAGCGAKNEASSTVPSGADFAPGQLGRLRDRDHRSELGPVAEGR